MAKRLSADRRRVAAHEPVTGTTGARAAPFREVSTPAWAAVVGREREVAQLQDALENVLAGRGRSVWIAGEPGIGKTRLVQGLADEAERRGAEVVWGSCWGGGAPDLWPWVQIVQACLRSVDDATLPALVGPHAAALTDLVASSHGEAGEPAGDRPPPARFRLFNAIAHFLDEYSRLRPLVLVFEDLHGSDPQSLLLLEFFTQDQSRRRILVLATYRPPATSEDSAVTRTVLEALRDPASERIELVGLDVEGSAAFLAAALGRQPPADLVAGLQRRCGGNPFFLGECARQLGDQPATGDQLLWPRPQDLLITRELAELIDQRLATLGPSECEVLRQAALLGDEFDESALFAAVAARLEGQIDPASVLRSAEQLGLLRRGGAVGCRRFTQAMVRERLLERPPQPPADADGKRPAATQLGPGGDESRPRAHTETAVFRKEGEYWTITFASQTCRMRDVKGLAYLGLLLRHPGRPIHVSEIVHLGSTGGDQPARFEEATSVRVGLGDAGAVIDRRAKEDYRRRLADLQDELDEAERFNDPGRAERARIEIEFLRSELNAAMGLGGRDRRAGSDAERARVNVTRSIARAIQKIDEQHPALARHLSQTVRTGTFCTYVAEPATMRTWEL